MSLDYFAWRSRLGTVRQQYGLYHCFQVWEVHGEDPVDIGNTAEILRPFLLR